AGDGMGDGVDVCRQIAADRRPRATKMILLTRLGIAAPQGSHTASVSKPVRPRDLFECLQRLATDRVEPGVPAISRPAAEAGPSGTRGRILIAEDNPVNQRVASLQVKNL